MLGSKHAVHNGTAEGRHHTEADEHDRGNQLEAECRGQEHQRPSTLQIQTSPGPMLGSPCIARLTMLVLSDPQPGTEPGRTVPHARLFLVGSPYNKQEAPGVESPSVPLPHMLLMNDWVIYPVPMTGGQVVGNSLLSQTLL